MTIDRSRLRADVKRLSKGSQALRPAQVTAVVRELLPEIERMRAEDNATWRVIAEALAAQGIKEGVDQKPLSERRLTSIVTKLRARKKQQVREAVGRSGRKDVSTGGVILETVIKRRAKLAPELTATPAEPDEELPLSEADIREAQRAAHAHLFKKD